MKEKPDLTSHTSAEKAQRTGQNELDQLAAGGSQAKASVPISSMCTVFAESEVVSLLAADHPRENIIRGIHEAIALRTAGMLRRIGLEEPLAMSGGVAKNSGVVRALEEQLGCSIFVPEEPQIVGALGAALIALDHLQVFGGEGEAGALGD